MSKVIAESEHIKIVEEFLYWNQRTFAVVRKETNESIIFPESELKELLSFNNLPLEE